MDIIFFNNPSFKMNPQWKATCLQIHIGEDLVRDRALRFLHMKLKLGAMDSLDKAAQAQLVAEIKKVFASVSIITKDGYQDRF